MDLSTPEQIAELITRLERHEEDRRSGMADAETSTAGMREVALMRAANARAMQGQVALPLAHRLQELMSEQAQERRRVDEAIDQARVHAQRILDNPHAHAAAEAMAVVILDDLDEVDRARRPLDKAPALDAPGRDRAEPAPEVTR